MDMDTKLNLRNAMDDYVRKKTGRRVDEAASTMVNREIAILEDGGIDKRSSQLAFDRVACWCDLVSKGSDPALVQTHVDRMLPPPPRVQPVDPETHRLLKELNERLAPPTILQRLEHAEAEIRELRQRAPRPLKLAS